MPFLFSVLAMETAHHHDRLENSDHCALCVWQQGGSQAVSAPAPPMLFKTLVFAFLFTFCLFYYSPVSFSPSGRSPPQNLL
ncbi:MAG TPA: hypothetical protein VJ873_06725 [bacterium]|nr:hypothetical protein [bacterium]